MLVLDDLHWADPASLDLLRVLARVLTDLPILMLATYRANEVSRHHPLALLLPLLAREGRAIRIDLWPLNEADLRELLHGRYALAPAEEVRLVAYMVGRSDGWSCLTYADT